MIPALARVRCHRQSLFLWEFSIQTGDPHSPRLGKAALNRLTSGLIASGSLPASPVGCKGVVPHLATFHPVSAGGEGEESVSISRAEKSSSVDLCSSSYCFEGNDVIQDLEGEFP